MSGRSSQHRRRPSAVSELERLRILTGAQRRVITELCRGADPVDGEHLARLLSMRTAEVSHVARQATDLRHELRQALEDNASLVAENDVLHEQLAAARAFNRHTRHQEGTAA